MKECLSLSYRGNGWPGYTIVQKQDGTTCSMDYDSSWGNILGRDVRKSCRFCIDGIGEYADIVCADAWYTKENGQVDFSEHEGRNAIIVRTNSGASLLKAARDSGKIYYYEDNQYFRNFKNIQKYQFTRRGTLKSTLFAMRIACRKVPSYSKDKLIYLSKYVDILTQGKRFLGTLKRLLKKKI